MLKKIQQYLLLNHPLLWNIRIVPILSITIVINLLSLFIGYNSTKISFNSTYSYSDYADQFSIYFLISIICIITAIIWLIFYSKNSALRAFYPQNSRKLYTEWLLIVVIVFSILLPIYSFFAGTQLKQRSYVSKEEAIKAIETLQMVKILIPTNKTDYFSEYPEGVPHVSKKGNGYYATDSLIQAAEQQDVATEYEGYPNFAQLSLLNYNGYSNYFYDEDLKLRNVGDVKEWLINEDKAAISQLMDDFLALQSKHKLKSNLDKDTWMKLIYNPSKYRVGDYNLIMDENINPNSYRYSSSNISYYLQHRELSNGYKQALSAYDINENSYYFLLTISCIAIAISLLIFSYRITSGKSWLIAALAMVIFLFINGFFTLINPLVTGSDFSFPGYLTILLILFIVEYILVIGKITQRSDKGRSSIYMNHLVWAIPAIPFTIFTYVYYAAKSAHYASDYYLETTINNDSLYRFLDDHLAHFMWGNLALTFITMWIFIHYIALKWKSLPED